MNFTFQLPTQIFFGAECILNNRVALNRWGKRALIVTGRSSARKSGALTDMQQALDQQGIPWAIFDQIEENPSFTMVEAGGTAARAHQADMIIGIGGGSPLDAAKAIAVLAVNKIPARQLFDGNFPLSPCPVLAVPLTAGTGSEVTHYSILTDTERQTKRSFADPGIFPKAAFLDARYTQSLSQQVTICTAIDALSHAIEGYLSKRSTVMSDHFAIEAIGHFRGIFASLEQNQLTLAEREKMLYASLLGGIVIAQTGTTMIHSLGYSLTYFRKIPHGRANGLLLAEALRFMQPAVPEKTGVILDILGMPDIDALKVTLERLLGEEHPWSSDELDSYASIAMQAANIANTPRFPDREDLKQVLARSTVTR